MSQKSVPDLVRRLRLAQKRLGWMKAIAGMAELDYEWLRECIIKGQISERLQTVLPPILERLESGELILRRHTTNSADWLISQYTLRERPAGAPTVQHRIVRAQDYSPWARCSACGNTRFSSFQCGPKTTTAGAGHIRQTNRGRRPGYFACDNCVDIPDRQMMGMVR